MRVAFGKALRQARTNLGMTQAEFTENSSRTYFSNLEHGRKCPSLDKVNQLADKMNISFASLMVITLMHFRNEHDLEAVMRGIRSELEVILNDNAPPGHR